MEGAVRHFAMAIFNISWTQAYHDFTIRRDSGQSAMDALGRHKISSRVPVESRAPKYSVDARLQGHVLGSPNVENRCFRWKEDRADRELGRCNALQPSVVPATSPAFLVPNAPLNCAFLSFDLMTCVIREGSNEGQGVKELDKLAELANISTLISNRAIKPCRRSSVDAGTPAASGPSGGSGGT